MRYRHWDIGRRGVPTRPLTIDNGPLWPIVPNMGICGAITAGAGDVLFTKTQRRVLTLLYGQPERSRYVNEIVRFADVGIGSVQRELEKLEAAELVTVTVVGNRKHYQANQQSPIFQELHGIVVKTFGLADIVRIALAPYVDRIGVAFIYGPLAAGVDQGANAIDIMIVAPDISYTDLVTGLAECEKEIGRSFKPVIYRPADLRRKLAASNAFLTRILKQRKIFLIGTKHDLPRPKPKKAAEPGS
jgi:hypothetical protein